MVEQIIIGVIIGVIVLFIAWVAKQFYSEKQFAGIDSKISVKGHSNKISSSIGNNNGR